MSHEATAWVARKSKAKGSELLVMYVIGNHAHPDGTGAYPSQSTISAEARLSVRGVQDILYRLIEMGELIVIRNRQMIADKIHGQNEYQIPGVVRDGFWAPMPAIEEDQPQSLRVADTEQPRSTHVADAEQTQIHCVLTKQNLTQPSDQWEEFQERQKREQERRAAKVKPTRWRGQSQRRSFAYDEATRESAQERRSREAREQVARVAPAIQAYRDRRAGQ